jgi:hypothetical protein
MAYKDSSSLKDDRCYNPKNNLGSRKHNALRRHIMYSLGLQYSKRKRKNQKFDRRNQDQNFYFLVYRSGPRLCRLFRNIIIFYGGELLAPRPTPKLEDGVNIKYSKSCHLSTIQHGVKYLLAINHVTIYHTTWRQSQNTTNHIACLPNNIASNPERQ